MTKFRCAYFTRNEFEEIVRNIAKKIGCNVTIDYSHPNKKVNFIFPTGYDYCDIDDFSQFVRGELNYISGIQCDTNTLYINYFGEVEGVIAFCSADMKLGLEE